MAICRQSAPRDGAEGSDLPATPGALRCAVRRAYVGRFGLEMLPAVRAWPPCAHAPFSSLRNLGRPHAQSVRTAQRCRRAGAHIDQVRATFKLDPDGMPQTFEEVVDGLNGSDLRDWMLSQRNWSLFQAPVSAGNACRRGGASRPKAFGIRRPTPSPPAGEG